MVDFDGVRLHCYIFWAEDIEFDIAPREVQGEAEFARLCAFMADIAAAVGRTMILTPENAPQTVHLQSDPPAPP